MSCRDGIHDKSCSRDHIAASKNPRHTCGKRVFVHCCCSATHRVHFIIQQGEVRPLTDGKDDQITRNHCLCPGDLVKIRPAIDKASEIHIHGSYACDMPVFVCYFLEGPPGIDINAFLLSVPDFPIVGGHFLSTLKARHAHPTCAQTH